MNMATARLRKAIGRRIQSLGVHVTFHGVETYGTVQDALLVLTDGSQFVFGCAGDGGVFVAQRKSQAGDAPGYATEFRAMAEVEGLLKEVDIRTTGLSLIIGKHEVSLLNDDDELQIKVDGMVLQQRLLMR